MLHDRDEKYEGSDEPEYHFSEEESGDYVDADLPKEEPPSAQQPPASKNSLKALAPSKRMLISLVVFLALVYIVYKMVAPPSSIPSTEISAPVTTAQTTKAPSATQAPASAATMNASNVMPVSTPAPTNATPTATQPEAIMTATAVPAATTSTIPPMPTVPASSATTTSSAPMGTVTPPTNNPPPATNAPTMMAVTVGGGMPGVITTPPTPPSTAPMVQAGQPSVVAAPAPMQQAPGMPSMIPVQSPQTTYSAATTNEAKIAALEADSSRLMSQMQADYNQKLNDFSSQNKALQDQVQTLNARITTMENQLSQLVQALTRQNNESMATPAPVSSVESSDQRVSYNVQAIIPGRAWLRSDNGETLTVAEGDTINHLGRVTKIDPYDGVVEINTGNKVVSLSYGTSA